MNRAASIAGLLSLVAAIAYGAEPADISGRWEISTKEFGQPTPLGNGRLIIELHDGQYSSKFGPWSLSGRMQPDGLHFACSTAAGPCGELILKTDGNSITGQGPIGGRLVTITGNRPAMRPYSVPRLYEFEPTEFHPQFSNTLPPVLKIFPGDSVHTKTVDAGGVDEKDNPSSPPGNPETGPFYIEGAMPGDTLVIHFDRIRPNRNDAFQGNTVSPAWVNPFYLQGTPAIPPARNNWKLDRNAGIATLEKPSAKLSRLSVSFEPMLGCVGVAPPAGQVILSGSLGNYGGNMDSNEVREGSALYLPVFQQGALLYVGDGHARQGDGEITGQGLETSMDVQFRVDVIEGRTVGQPWVENDDYVMVMGIAGSLDQAFTQATTGMMRWLNQNYGLKSDEAAAVMGNFAKYEVAEVVDPQVNVVAKIPKSALAQIPKD